MYLYKKEFWMSQRVAGDSNEMQESKNGPVAAVNLRAFFQPRVCSWSVESTTFIGGAEATAGSILNLYKLFRA